jgi:hypothetical protein
MLKRDMRCHQCHTIAGEELPVIPALDPPYVELGGRVAKVKTYGELVTAIIFPSNDLARGYAEEAAMPKKSFRRTASPKCTTTRNI